MRADAAELQRRIRLLEEAYRSCRICPEDCGVDRMAGETGSCGLGDEGRVYKELLHLGEEPEVGPTHAIYLAGCNFRCAFCSEREEVEHPTGARPTEPRWLAGRIRLRREQGARSVTFVGGNPDVQPLFVLRTLLHAPPDTRVVWNGNLWLTADTLDLLCGIAWLFVPDMKFGPGACDLEISGVAQTFDRVLSLLCRLRDRGEQVLLRHLLLPGHAECCTLPILRALARSWPGLGVNLMSAYRPFGLRGSQGPLAGRLERSERESTIARARAEVGDRLDLRLDGLRLSHM